MLPGRILFYFIAALILLYFTRVAGFMGRRLSQK